jgi:hypothetical protein
MRRPCGVLLQIFKPRHRDVQDSGLAA